MVQTRGGKTTGGEEDKIHEHAATKAEKKQTITAKVEPAGAGDKHAPADEDQTRPHPADDDDDRKRQKTNGGGVGKKVKHEQDKAAGGTGDTGSPTVPKLLEKGRIYFFFRGRVNVEDPQSLKDVARSYIVLRPFGQHDDPAENGEKSTKDAHNCRLIALPKKVLPRSGRERYMAFVEKADASYAALADEFLQASTHETKTRGEQHVPAATALAEGIYALTSTGRESHLVYLLTLPEGQLGDAQQAFGLTRREGSFIVTTKNPEYPGPGGQPMVGGGPEYPKSMLESFRKLRWVPLRPEHLDYPRGELLLVGESHGAAKALGKEEEGDEPKEQAARELSQELDESAEADLAQMRHLSDSDAQAVFASLRAKDQANGQPELTEALG